MSGGRNLLRDAGGLAALRLGLRVLGLAVGWLVARLIGPEGLGRLAVPNLLIALAPFLSLGFAEALILELSGADEDERETLRGRALAGTLLGFLAAAAGLLGLAALDSGWFSRDGWLLGLCLAATGLNLLFKFAYSDLTGRRDIQRLAGLQALQAVARAVAVVALALALPAPWKLYALHAGMAISFASAVGWYLRGAGVPRLRLDGRSLELARRGLPLAAVSFFFLLLTSGDRLLLSRLVETGELGLYEQAVLLREGLLIVPAVLLTVLIPDYAERARRSDPALAGDVRRQTLSLAQLSAPLLGLGIAQVGWITAWILPAFAAGLDLYRLTFLAVLPLYISYIPVSSLLARGRTGALLGLSAGLFAAASAAIAVVARRAEGAELLPQALLVVSAACLAHSLVVVSLQARQAPPGHRLRSALEPYGSGLWLLAGLGLLRAAGRLQSATPLDGLLDGLAVLVWQAPALALYQRRTGRLSTLLRAWRRPGGSS